MPRRLPTIFWKFSIAVGLMSAAVCALPGLVFVGLMGFIVPGLILWICPTVFLYTTIWLLARETVLSIFAILFGPTNRILCTMVDTLIVAMLVCGAIAVPIWANEPIARIKQELKTGDEDVIRPIAIPAIVALDRTDASPKRLTCDLLCLRLLYNGAASRVVVLDSTGRRPKPPQAFWIERRASCPPLAVEQRYYVFYEPDFKNFADFRTLPSTYSRTTARIAAGECLIDGPGRPEEARLTITYRDNLRQYESDHPWRLRLDAVAAKRLEVRIADGSARFSRTEITSRPLRSFLFIDVGGSIFGGDHISWARREDVEGNVGPSGRDVLPDLLGAAIRLPAEPPIPRPRSDAASPP